MVDIGLCADERFGMPMTGVDEDRRARCAAWSKAANWRALVKRCVAGDSCEDGFTLIELLVAIVLLGFLTAILLAGISLATQHVSRQGGHMDRAASISAVEGFVRLQLAQASAIVPTDTKDGSVVFAGSGESVSFVAAAPQSIGSGGLEVFAIARMGRRLVARSAPFSGTLAGQAKPRETVLLDGVSAANFRYYGTVAPAKQPAWHTAWREMPDLPAIVRLDLTFVDGTRLPSLLVRPRLAPMAYLR